jgi:hypothetical protein
MRATRECVSCRYVVRAGMPGHARRMRTNALALCGVKQPLRRNAKRFAHIRRYVHSRPATWRWAVAYEFTCGRVHVLYDMCSGRTEYAKPEDTHRPARSRAVPRAWRWYARMPAKHVWECANSIQRLRPHAIVTCNRHRSYDQHYQFAPSVPVQADKSS